MTRRVSRRAPDQSEAQALFDEDVKETGYVWNVSRLWAYQPDTVERLFELMSQAFKPSGLELPPARHPCHRRRLDPRGLVLLPGVGRQAFRQPLTRPLLPASWMAPTPS